MSGCATACKPICLYFALTADIINLIFEYHEKSIIVLFVQIADYGQELIAYHCEPDA